MARAPFAGSGVDANSRALKDLLLELSDGQPGPACHQRRVWSLRVRAALGETAARGRPQHLGTAPIALTAFFFAPVLRQSAEQHRQERLAVEFAAVSLASVFHLRSSGLGACSGYSAVRLR